MKNEYCMYCTHYMCVFVCTYRAVTRSENKIHRIGWEFIGGTTSSVNSFDWGCIFENLPLPCNTVNYCEYCTPYMCVVYGLRVLYIKDNALSERKQNEKKDKPLTLSIINFIRPPCHFLQQRYTEYTSLRGKQKRMPM